MTHRHLAASGRRPKLLKTEQRHDLVAAQELIAEFAQLGIAVWVQDDRLRYKAPHGVLTAGLRQRLTDNKGPLLALLSAQRNPWSALRLPAVTRRPPDQQPQLSYMQQRLWFLDRLLPGRATYNMAYAYRLRGALDAVALRQALRDIVRRHEVLRTEIVVVEGAARPRVADGCALELPLTDLTGCPAPDRAQRAHRRVADEARQPFDLGRAPLLRARLLRMDADEHWFVLCLHHVVNDDWSFEVLWRELAVCYQARRLGAEPGLPELGIQYADFAAWQHEQLSDGRLKGQLDYWKCQLNGLRSTLDLPLDRQRPAQKTHRGELCEFIVPQHIVEALRQLARHRNATLYMVLVAALKTLLHRYARVNDIAIGTAIAGRNRPELAPLIGFFINTLVLRTDLSGDPGFSDLVDRVREVALAAYANQDVDFECVIETLQPERDFGRTPLFNVFLVLHQAPEVRRLNGLQIEQLPVSAGTAKFDLTLELTEAPEGLLSGSFEYDTDLFEHATINRVVGHFLVLLGGIAATPDRRLSELPLLTDAERHQMLVEWNATAREYGREARLHRLIEQQAAHTPHSVALEFEGRALTYAQLNCRANQLARVLRARGVGPDVLVGVCAERSFEMVAALLAVLKAGGAYVPLDPSYPAARLGQMLEDVRSPLVLAQTHLADRLPTGVAQVLLLEASWSAYAGEALEDLEDAGTPQDLAYVIFTSGSTGRPKGAMNTHRGICNFLLWLQQEYGLCSDDRLLQNTSFAFDPSLWEFFWPLLSGARLVIARPEGHKDSAYLVRLIRESGITTLGLVPSMLRVFLEEEGLEACASLRRIFCGGEALPHALQERCFARLPGVELHNLYGPTEAAVAVTHWACRRADERLTIPIGRPVANTQVYVLDPRAEPIPVGVSGELHIGGVQVGRGYIGRADLTTERFVPDPFSPTPGALLYRTGDLARFLADGAIEYLGRLDDQAKIRGYRVEPGEIEAALAAHPEVRQAAVYVWEAKPGDARIVACCVPASEGRLAPIGLRKHLQARLPEYMIPQHFLPVAEIPLTPNGKVDRERLPRPVVSEASFQRYEAPFDRVETVIAEVWTQLIRPSRPIGRSDKFFEMGGHSLLAMQALQQMEQRLRVKLGFATLLHESLADIAKRCRQELAMLEP